MNVGHPFDRANPPFPPNNYQHPWQPQHNNLWQNPIKNGICQPISRPNYANDRNTIRHPMNVNINQNVDPIPENHMVNADIQRILTVLPENIHRPYSKSVDQPDEPSQSTNDTFGDFLTAYVEIQKNDKKKSSKVDLSRMNRSNLSDEYVNLSTDELDKKVRDTKEMFKKHGAAFIDDNVKVIAERHNLRTPEGRPINTGKEAVDAIYNCKCTGIDDGRAVIDHFTFCMDDSTLTRMAKYIANQLGVLHTVGLQEFAKKFCYLTLKESVRKRYVN